MPSNSQAMNLTLYFDYENNEAGFKHIMDSLDKIGEQAEQAIRSSSNFANKEEMDKSVREYKNYINRIKEALETNWSPETQTFNLKEAVKYDPAAFDKIKNGFNEVSTSIIGADSKLNANMSTINKYSEKLDNFKLTLANAFRYNVVNEFVDVISSEIRQTIQYVEDLDQALNNIRIVSGESAEDMYKFAEFANEAGQELGRTATEYARAAEIYYQQGLKQEDVIARTNDTLLLANITGTSVSDAADKLTAVMNGYQLATEDSTRALDVMAKLGADTATDFDEIASAMQKVAAQANSADLTLEETSSMLATIMSITREAPETVGTSVKAIIARLNELKFSSGEETSRVEKQFKNIGMSIFDANGDLKDTRTLFNEIADAFKTADKNTKAVIATAVAGAEQQNRFLTLMENWDTYNEYLDKAYNSSGASLEQNEIYMDSLEAKSKQLKSTVDSIKFDLFMGEDWGEILDTINEAAKATRVIVDDFGGLQQILAVGGALMVKMFGPEILASANKIAWTVKDLVSNLKNGTENGKTLSISEFFFGVKDTQLDDFYAKVKANTKDIGAEQVDVIAKVNKVLGEGSAKKYEAYINNLRDAVTKIANLKKEMKEATGLKEADLLKDADLNNFSENIFKNLKLPKEAKQNFTNSLKNELSNSFSQAGKSSLSFSEQLKILERVLRETGVNSEGLSKKVSNLYLEFETLEGKATKAERGIENLNREMETAQRFQNFSNAMSALTIGLSSFSNVVDQLEQGDKIGALSGGLTGIGSALMMIPGPAAAVGATLTAVGAAVELGKGIFNKYQESLKQTRDDFLTTAATLGETNISKVSEEYGRLVSLASRSEEQQSALNNRIEELQRVLGTDDSFVAYYDEAGNAVYKTKEQVDELIKSQKESIALQAKVAVESAHKAAKDDYADYDKQTKKVEDLTTKLQQLNEIEDIYAKKGASAALSKAQDYGMSDLQFSTDILQTLQAKIQQTQRDIDKTKEKIGDSTEDIKKEIQTVVSASLLSVDDQNIRHFVQDISTQVQNEIDSGTFDSPDLFAKSFENLAPTLQKVKNDIDNNKIEIDWNSMVAGDPEEVQKLFEELGKIWTGDTEALDVFKERLKENSKSFGVNTEALEDWEAKLAEMPDIFDETGEKVDDFNEIIDGLEEKFGDFEGFDQLKESLQKATDVEDQKNAYTEFFNTAITNVKGLEEGNKALMVSELDRLGVLNSTEVAEGLLKANRTSLLEATNQLYDANGNLISGENWLTQTMGGVQLATDNASLAMYTYYLNKVATGQIDISSVELSGANALIAMAQALGGAGEQMKKWIQLKKIEAQIKSGKADDITLGQLERRASELSDSLNGWTPSKISVSAGFFDIDKWRGKTGGSSKPAGSGSKGSSGGGSKSAADEYQAEVDKYQKIKDQIEEIERQIKEVDSQVEDTADFDEKNKLLDKQIALMEQEQALQLQLNNARDKEIAQNVKLLRQKGFNVDYDPEKDTLVINNLEKLEKLKGDNAKKTEELIKKTKELNKDNQDAADKWKDLAKSIKEATEKQEENRRSKYKDTLEDTLFKTTYFEDLYGKENDIKDIYINALNLVMEELQRLNEQGLNDTDDYYQEVVEKYYDLKSKIQSIEQDILDNTLKNYDRIIDALEDSTEKQGRILEMQGKKITAINNEINRVIQANGDDLSSYGEYLLDLYDQLIEASKAEYEARKKMLEDQKDKYDDTIDAVTNAIDEEINRLKEQQEAQEKANDEKERELELMKLKADLEKAQRQRTIQVYHEGIGFEWEADKEAINAAQKALDDFYNDGKGNDPIQDRIDELEKYKEKWESIPDKIEDTEKKIKAEEILGKNWQDDVFDLREDILNDFADNYEGLVDSIAATDNEWKKSSDALIAKLDELIEKLKGVQTEVANTKDAMDEGQGRVFAMNSNGTSVKGLQPGDYTTGVAGTWQIGEANQEGFTYHQSSGYWAKKVNDTGSVGMNGEQITDETVIKQLIPSIEENKENLDKNTTAIAESEVEIKKTESTNKDLTKKVEIVNTTMTSSNTNLTDLVKKITELINSLNSYTNSINKAVKSASSSAENSKSYASKAKSSADSAAQSAKEAKAAAKTAKTKSETSVEKKHRGINAGPVGTYKNKQLDTTLIDIANGDIQGNEILALLKKDEVVLLPEQLKNIASTLNFSLDAIEKLNGIQNQVFSAGVITGMKNGVSDKVTGTSINFGDINIEMNGVNDVDSFSQVIAANVKSVFAQTVASV